MSSMVRKIMRSMRRNNAGMGSAGSLPALGSVRAGMHCSAEHAYRRSRMAEAAERDPEDPAEEIAEGTVSVEADAELLEEVSGSEGPAEDPEGEEDRDEDPETRDEDHPAAGERLAADYSGERIPVLDPVTGGDGLDEDADLIYASGDAVVKAVRYPVPGSGEREGVMPYIPESEDPSANVPAVPEETE